jgi:hypothetical protein
MNDPKPLASLSPTLLARKGAARPAMRPQLQPMQQFHEATARQLDDDLGWNDMGHEDDEVFDEAEVDFEEAPAGEVVAFNAHSLTVAVDVPEVPMPEVFVSDVSVPEVFVPEVVRQRESIAERVARPAAPAKPRRSALAHGRRAAFTLRLDAERHLKLRLACTINNRSAQQMVIEALDQLIDELPDIASLAAQVSKRRTNPEKGN